MVDNVNKYFEYFKAWRCDCRRRWSIGKVSLQRAIRRRTAHVADPCSLESQNFLFVI